MHHSIRIKKCLLILQISLLSVIFFSCAYSPKATKKLLSNSKATIYDIVIVPGIPFENGKWSYTMKGRVYWAKYLYDNGITKNIMFSGSSVYSPYYEGMIMALYAEALGVPKNNIFYEIQAEHSTENAYYSYHLAKKLGFIKIAIASDPFQTKTLKSFSHKKLSRDIGMIPMVVDTMKALQPIMTDPEIDFKKAFNKDFVSIKKREGFFKRLRGTMGYNIKKDTSNYFP
jgi:uncharacterized SAM-binding protein YcdF (DUF218 family)